MAIRTQLCPHGARVCKKCSREAAPPRGTLLPGHRRHHHRHRHHDSEFSSSANGADNTTTPTTTEESSNWVHGDASRGGTDPNPDGAGLRELYRRTEHTLDRKSMRSPWVYTASETQDASEDSIETPPDLHGGKIAAVFVPPYPGPELVVPVEERRHRGTPRARGSAGVPRYAMHPPPLAAMPIPQGASQVRRVPREGMVRPHPPLPPQVVEEVASQPVSRRTPPAAPPTPEASVARGVVIVDAGVQVGSELHGPAEAPMQGMVSAASIASTSLPPTPRVRTEDRGTTPHVMPVDPPPPPPISRPPPPPPLPLPPQPPPPQVLDADAARRAYHERQKAAEVARRTNIALSAAAEAHGERARAEAAAERAAEMLRTAVQMMAASPRAASPRPPSPPPPPPQPEPPVAEPTPLRHLSPVRNQAQRVVRCLAEGEQRVVLDERKARRTLVAQPPPAAPHTPHTPPTPHSAPPPPAAAAALQQQREVREVHSFRIPADDVLLHGEAAARPSPRITASAAAAAAVRRVTATAEAVAVAAAARASPRAAPAAPQAAPRQRPPSAAVKIAAAHTKAGRHELARYSPPRPRYGLPTPPSPLAQQQQQHAALLQAEALGGAGGSPRRGSPRRGYWQNFLKEYEDSRRNLVDGSDVAGVGSALPAGNRLS